MWYLWTKFGCVQYTKFRFNNFKWISSNLNNCTKMSDMGPIEYFICGGFGGICTVLVGHPLDTIKVSTFFFKTIVSVFLSEKVVYID